MVIVEVVYTSPEKQKLLTLQLPEGSSALEAISQSGILQEFPEIDLEKNKIGVFGEFISLTQPLRHLDRIEIYRPLLIDPKQARLNRVKKKYTQTP